MDIRLNYVERGSGEPLILLHGNGESLEYFSNQLEFFPAWYRVIAVDTRGHGQSPRGEAPFTIDQFADDLRDFMRETGIAAAHILGFSDGGNIALTFALKYPKMVRSLILNGANLDPSGVKTRVQLPIVLGYRFAKLFSRGNAEAKKKTEMLGLMVNWPKIRPGRLKYMNIPTLVIAGTHDMIKATHTGLIFESIPGAKIEIIDGDHFIASKNPADFNAAVMSFLVGLKK